MTEKVPTIKEMAKLLNISTSAVSRALHDNPSIGLRTRMRVHQLAAELNYEPNQTAIFFKQRKTFTIGVILPFLSESFFSSAISGIEDFAKSKKYNILLGQSYDDDEREKQVLEKMKNHRVDGVLISVAKNTKNYDHFTSLQKYNIPIVFFDRIPDIPNIHYVACKLKNGMTDAVNFLIAKGHKTIALINGPETIFASHERLDGYLTTLKENKIKVDKNLIISTNLLKQSTHEAMKKLLALKKRPTAIITFNDYVALDAIQYAKKEKIRINKDLHFVSFANLPICDYLETPPLASVEQFPYKQGEKATEILLQLIESETPDSDNQKHIIEPKLETRI